MTIKDDMVKVQIIGKIKRKLENDIYELEDEDGEIFYSCEKYIFPFCVCCGKTKE